MKDFNAEKEVNNIVKFIRDYYKENNLGGAILGISGGKDSGIVAALLVKALGRENVIGVTMPCHSQNEDKTDAKLVSDYYGFKLINFDLTSTYDIFKEELKKLGNFNETELKDSDINIKPRLRMLTLYYLAAMYSKIYHKTYIVAGTSNKCELYVGYFTKGGDSVSDISPIADYTVDEVIEIGKYLNVPKKVLYKTPSDGLSGMSDEEKLGVTYKDIASYMNNPLSVEIETRNKIKHMHEVNLHKFNTPTFSR
ncbi:MAG: NAD(+) synthase [Bacilli bacterium]|nr:NAD(+) synthase [Bacilli bacterium]